MKGFTVLLVILCINTFLYAQPFGESGAEFRITKLEYKNSSGEEACTYFRYNNDGTLYKALWILDDKSRSSINFYEYGLNGKLISAYREFSDGLFSYEFFTYNSLGNKISEHFYRSDSVSGYATYQYEDNNIKQAVFRNHLGWLNGTVRYEYNEQKKKKSAFLMKGGNTICKINYKYDDNNNLIKEFWDFPGKWNQSFVYHYEKKDMKNNYYSSPFLTSKGESRICKENYTFNNEIGGPSFYYYNSEGLLYKKIFIRSDSISTTTFYEYDKDRKLVSSQRNYSEGSIVRFNYIYDEKNNLVFRSYNRGDTITGFESYLYNSEGDLIKSYIKNYDNWLTGTVQYDVNGLGRITSGEFKGENGFDAKISFNYNNKGMLSEILWEFTFGKFQQYKFEYALTECPQQ